VLVVGGAASDARWAAPAAHSRLAHPAAVRLGDFDLDGFPDALAGLATAGGGGGGGGAHLALLRNARGGGFDATEWRPTSTGAFAVVGSAAAQAPARGGSAKGDGGGGGGGGLGGGGGGVVIEAMEAVPAGGDGAYSGAFYDADERGALDVLLLAGTAAEPRVRLLKNDFSTDDFFLKVAALMRAGCYCRRGPRARAARARVRLGATVLV
jgi:hypothetical protein